MRDYETTIVLRANLEAAEIDKEIQTLEEGITSRGGEIVLVDRWGRRRLAYEIDKQHEGYYAMIRYACNPEVPAELERRFRINERLLRHLTVLAETPRPLPEEATPPGAEGEEGAPAPAAPLVAAAAAAPAAPLVAAAAAAPEASAVPLAAEPESE